MQPIKYKKIKDNELDFDTMTLVNIVSHDGELVFFFIVEYTQKHNGKFTIERELISVCNDDFSNIVSVSYQIQ